MRGLFIFILILALGFNAFAQGHSKDKLEETKTQIHILNLLNGLELSQEQMRLILQAAYRAKNISFKAKQTIADRQEEVASTYDKVLDVAKTGSLVVPKDIASGVHRVNRDLDEVKKTAHQELADLVAQVKNNLEPHQICVLEDYKPCIIPQVKEGRIGQASNSFGFVQTLGRVRALPEYRYNLCKEEFVQRQIEKVRAKVPIGVTINEAKLRNQLLKAMDEVRVMSEVDFALKKEEIAQEIKDQLAPERPPMDIGVKIARFLLSPEIIPILEERLTSKNSS